MAGRNQAGQMILFQLKKLNSGFRGHIFFIIKNDIQLVFQEEAQDGLVAINLQSGPDANFGQTAWLFR